MALGPAWCSQVCLSPPLPVVFSLRLSVILYPPSLLMSPTCLASGAERKSSRALWAPQALLSPFWMGASASLPPGSRAQIGPWNLLGARLAYPDVPTGTLAGKGRARGRGSCVLEHFSMLFWFLLLHPSFSSSFQKKRFLCGRGRKPEQVQGVLGGHFLFQSRIWDKSEEAVPEPTPRSA